MKVIKETSKKALQQKAADKINSLLEKYKKSTVLLLFSGGSAFSLISLVDDKYLAKNLTVGMLDDRYTYQEKVSNFGQFARKGFYQKAMLRETSVIDSRIRRHELLPDLGRRMGNALKAWRKNNPNGKIIITQGIGSDGHTAGIMPYPEDKEMFKKYFEKKKWITAYDAGSKTEHSQRVTVTFPFLTEQVDHSIVFVVGKEKKQVLKSILDEKSEPNEFPGRVIHQMKDVYLFTNLLT